MEKTLTVQTLKVDYECDKCGVGYMRPTGQCLTPDPPLYPHICTNCGHHQTFRVTYPYIDYQ